MRALKFGAVGLLIALLAAAGIWISLLRPLSAGDDSQKDIVFSAGQSRQEIATKLTDAGLIRSQAAFLLYARFIRLVVLPGTYELSPGLSASQIGEVIGSGQFKTAKVVIIEGWRATDMEKYLVEEKRLPQFAGFAIEAEKSEGYLFPDTYEIKVDATTADVIKLMRDNFDKRTKDLKITPETVILASIVEREAKDDAERGAVAQIYINRLAKGMKLEADPTIQYAKGNWKAVLLSEYRSVVSPYNTYLIDGLPPGAICNPGLKSIQAVINPTPHEYFYFFHAKGETFFSKTYEEHVAKVKKNF